MVDALVLEDFVVDRGALSEPLIARLRGFGAGRGLAGAAAGLLYTFV